MAYNDSGELSPSQSYQLGGYTFQLRSNYDGDEEVTGIVARMTYNGETKIGGIDIDGQATIESWSVEANETEATVYCTIKKYDRKEGKATDELYPGVIVPISGQANYASGVHNLMATGATFVCHSSGTIVGCFREPGTFTAQAWAYPGPSTHTYQVSATTRYELNGKPFYYALTGAVYDTVISPQRANENNIGVLCYIALYGNVTPEGEGETTEVMVARFAIDLHEADPEDWDEPGDTGDPSYTLNISVTGASAGTHNASNIPLDAGPQNVYGSGGIGGNGGGGGAGASTVIIYEFTTDKAGSVNQEAYAREAGAGGPGGPGGRGADGCIIIFY